MDINLVINAIKTIAPAASPIIHQAQRHETIIKVKKKLGLDPAQPPKDTDAVYAHALVEYGVDKPESILKFFREKEIKTAFCKAFTDNPSAFVTDAENFLERNILGDEIREAKIDLLPEFQQFYKVFVSVAKRTRTPAEVIADSKFKALRETPSYPDEFKALIEEKIKTFCGRQFVFDKLNSFLKEHNKGYFTVIGDAGMGKSTIAAKYVYDHKSICYFNDITSDNKNRPEKFLTSIRQQLIHRYELQDAVNADLPTLLTKVSEKLAADERLVIVVDALDEVEQEPGAENLLYLPKTLPERIYFLLTRRHYPPNKKRLFAEGVKQEELDLTASQYANENRKDVKEYISLFINDDPEHKDDLRKWIQSHISPKDFIEQVAAKSENNFMYLRYVLPDIAKGLYQDLTIKELPNGLQEYYQQHWVRMEMENEPKKLMVIVLFILVEIETAITCEMIAEIAQQDEVDVARVLDKWREFLKTQEIQG